MQWQVKDRTSFPVLKVELEDGESIKSKGGSVMAMSGNMSLEGKADGGILKSIGRLFSGENLFMQHIKSENGKGWAMLSAPVPGDIVEIKLDGVKELTVQKDCFLAGTEGVDVATKMQSLSKGLFSGEGLFVVRLSGNGTAFLETYGSVHAFDIKAGERLFIDNGNLVAWESELDCEITKGATTWFSALTTGSGIMCKFKGEGRVWAQTCNLQNLAGAIFPYLPQANFTSNNPDKRG